MTWRLYALTSGGAVVVTALAALVRPVERVPSVPSAVPQAVDRAGAVVDLSVQADRLRSKLAAVGAYHEPVRDAFRFGAARHRAVAPPTPVVGQASPVVAPVRPPYALSGMATSVENGVAQRTAILSSLQGVSLVKEGDVLDAGYRVVSIDDESVILESAADGARTTLRLSEAR